MVLLVVRQSIGMKTLAEALADKGKVDVVSAQVLRDDALEFGVKVGEIAIRDIMLPGGNAGHFEPSSYGAKAGAS